MKFLISFFKPQRKDKKGNSVGTEDHLLKFGREQFKTLMKKGITVPVVLL